MALQKFYKKEHELELSCEKLMNIIEFLPDATFVIDQNKRVIAWNRALEIMTGVSKNEMLGKGDYEYSTPFYGYRRPVLIDLMDISVTEIICEYSYLRREGNTLFAENYISDFCGGEGAHIWITASPLFDSKGVRIGAIESVRDISDLRRAEVENMRLSGQLRQAQKMEAIGQLAGGIAHDFNNLQTAILGYAQLIVAKTTEGELCRRYAEQIITASERASKLTSDMLAFGRRQHIDEEQHDMKDIVHEIEDMLQRVIGEDCHLHIEASEEELPIVADAGQLQQVFVNLVTNARDAMPDGGEIKIRIFSCNGEPCILPEEHEHKEHLQKYVVFSVSDTGDGMDEITLARLFEPFYTTKEIGKGSGLGLSMAYGIVTQHGGSISVSSRLGEGSTFYISLPLKHGDKNKAISETTDSELKNKEKIATILLVEDHDIARDVISELLQEVGYNVIVAVDGIEALARYRLHSGAIDLLLLDVIMPRMNGRDTLTAIVNERGEEIPYLFMSGYTDDVINSKGKLERELNFVAKPISPDDLLFKLASVLKEAEIKKLVS